MAGDSHQTRMLLGGDELDKILLYADADNLSKEQVIAYVQDAHKMAGNKYQVICKSYGVRKCIGSLVSFYVSQGFEFCDTDDYANTKKNLTDIKIITDCLVDVLATYKSEIKMIYILSNDSDFKPLEYKLKSLGIETVFISSKPLVEARTVQTFTQLLYVEKYLPIKRESLTRVFYEDLCSVVSHLYNEDDEMILAFLSERYYKLRKCTKTQYDIILADKSINELKLMTLSTFIDEISQARAIDLVELIQFFSSRFFGAAVTNKDCIKILKIIKEV